jgi:hypothetical protein
MPAPLTVSIKPFGPSSAKVEAAARRLAGHASVRRELGDAHHRLLSYRLADEERKRARPASSRQVAAKIYDYANERTLTVTGGLAGPGPVETEVSAKQPPPAAEELAAAGEILRRHRELGPALRRGEITPYRPMPPLAPLDLADGRRERTIAVGLLPGKGARKRHEIVAVSLARRRVIRFDGSAPARSLASTSVCGVADAGQPTAEQGTPGAATIVVSRGNTVLWELVAVRPAASTGTWGSGVELQHVRYKGRSVLYRAHVPILNVRYDGDKCGPYRDWQWQEGMLQADGADVAPGFRLCPHPAKTILESGTDTGNFLGVAAYLEGEELVLVSELEAGWYRYVSRWRLHSNGRIRPRFGFAAVDSSCVCNRHHHHAYWRLDFDITAAGQNHVRELNNPALPGGTASTLVQYETKRMRDPAHKRRWVVEDTAGHGYVIQPGPNDQTAAGDPFARGDLWVLRYRATELDDNPITSDEADLDRFVNHEPVAGQDVVVWYGAHFTHDVRHEGPSDPAHIVGPDLLPVRW